MNKQIALLSLIQILSALSCGIFILILTLKLLRYYSKKKLGMNEPNMAYHIIMATVIFSIGIVMSDVIQPILDSFRLLTNKDIPGGKLIGQFILTGGIYIFIAYMASLIVTVLGIGTYSFITPLNEQEEIKNNNIAVAILVSTIIITLTLMTRGGIILFIESFVPYPEFAPNR